jgi:hypothetical protein
MEVAGSFEIWIPVYQTNRCDVPEDRTLNTHRYENLKSYTEQFGLIGRRFCNRCNWIIGINQYFFYYWWGGTKSTRYCGHFWPIVQTPDDRWGWFLEQLVGWLAGETEVLGENLPQRHFVHHKSQMTRPGLEPRTAAVGSQRLTAWAMARPL